MHFVIPLQVIPKYSRKLPSTSLLPPKRVVSISAILGFCMAMMEIVDDSSLQVDVKQAALIQLKNTIKIRWSAKKEELEPAQKQHIKNALILAVMRCHKTHKLIKLYKQVITIIVGHEYKQWLPVRQVVDMIAKGQDITALLHVLL